MGERGSRPSVWETSVEAEQGSQEARHHTQGGEGRARTQYVQLAEGCTPITTYPSDLLDEIPWESGLQKTTLQSFVGLTMTSCKMIFLVWISLQRTNKV